MSPVTEEPRPVRSPVVAGVGRRDVPAPAPGGCGTTDEEGIERRPRTAEVPTFLYRSG